MRDATSERFWSKVRGDSFEDCWVWHGSMKGDTGYGQFKAGRTLVRVHRFAYEDMVGPIPDGLTLDHLCRNRACVNPWHLEPVTIQVNTWRKQGSDLPNEYCPRGHAYSGDNLYMCPTGRRKCRACNAVHTATYRAKLRSAA